MVVFLLLLSTSYWSPLNVFRSQLIAGLLARPRLQVQHQTTPVQSMWAECERQKKTLRAQPYFYNLLPLRAPLLLHPFLPRRFTPPLRSTRFAARCAPFHAPFTCSGKNDHKYCNIRQLWRATGVILWPVQERSPLPVHKPGINSLYLFVTRTVSHLSSVISKLYYLRRRTV